MNMDALLDDLEASFTQLKAEPERLSRRKPVGYSNVTFGKDHFTGLASNDASWHLVTFRANQVIHTEPGESSVSTTTINRQVERLVNLWLRVETEGASFRGRLLSIENRLLIFREFCVPLSAIRRVELHAVDNQDRA